MSCYHGICYFFITFHWARLLLVVASSRGALAQTNPILAITFSTLEYPQQQAFVANSICSSTLWVAELTYCGPSGSRDLH